MLRNTAMNPIQPPTTFYHVSRLSGPRPCITLVVALGVLYQNLAEYLTGIDSQTLAQFTPFDDALSHAVNPDTLILLLGPHLNLVCLSVEPRLLQLFSTFTALANVEISIHLSVWSARLADRLPALPTSVRKAVYLVSNLRRADRELVRVYYDATIETFTVSFSATLPDISLTLKGRLPNLSFMFALHLALAKITFASNCVVRLQIQATNELCLVLFRASGSMRDARKILEALRALAQRHGKYMLYSLNIEVPMLYHRDELKHFIHALVFSAPAYAP
ncbi:hypothetical protein BDP27DRAFT_197110 [Rhodocollybia butyracea]|uniref:Uncharacterized protein n=1 Tax=Rhodocollybia butyracea TaxID=206335 RepID=A0A9P5Q5N1_9AGAR|nr:hypothetical protein BDP27DRAFT_197110 [Rhodocollybia butyracea]